MTDRAVTDSPRSTPMTARRMAGVAALTLVLAACSGGDDGSSSTSLAPPSTAEATSTTVPATTPAPTPPTDPAPETSPPTLPPESSTPPTSLPPDEAQVKQDVIDAAFAAWKSLNDLRLDPTNDDLLEPLANSRTGASLDSAIEIITNYRVRNQRSITHPEFPASFEAYPETVLVDLELGIASVEYCWLNSNTLVEIGGGDGGSDLVLNDDVSSNRERSDLVLTDRGWLESGGIVLKEFSEATRCVE